MNSPRSAAESGPTVALGPWRELRSGVYVAVAQPESVNLGLIVGAHRTLLIDTGSSPEQGREIRDSVAAVTDRPLAAVVVTHWHYDHAFGLAAFGDVPTDRPRVGRMPGCRRRRRRPTATTARVSTRPTWRGRPRRSRLPRQSTSVTGG